MVARSKKKRKKNDIKNKYIFEHDFSSNFHGFCKPETLKITIFLEENNDFQKINVFWKNSQKSILTSILASQNLPKSIIF